MKYVKDGVFNTDKAKNDIEATKDLYDLLLKFAHIYTEVLSDNNQMTMLSKLDLCKNLHHKPIIKLLR